MSDSIERRYKVTSRSTYESADKPAEITLTLGLVDEDPYKVFTSQVRIEVPASFEPVMGEELILTLARVK